MSQEEEIKFPILEDAKSVASNSTLTNISSKLKTLGSAGPFQVIDGPAIDGPSASELDHPPEGPRRRYDCCNYETCLKIAAAINWDSFTCRGCCGDVNEKLLWRAQHEVRKDQMAKIICNLPDARSRKIENGNPVGLKLVADKVG